MSDDIKPAGLLIRSAAAYLNLFIFISLISLLVLPFVGLQLIDHITISKDLSLHNPLIILLLIILLQLILDTGLQAYCGWNLGKLILGLKVVDDRDLNTIGFKRIIVRTICYLASFAPFGLGIIAMAFNKKKRALHDLISNTRVIHDPQTKIHKFFRVSIGSVMSLIFLISMLILPGSLVSAAYIVFNNFQFASNIPTIESKALKKNPNSEVKLMLKDGHLTALTKISKSDANYIKFTIDKDSKHSSISKQALKRLGISFVERSLSFIKASDKWSFSKRIIVPELITRNAENKDFNFRNVAFYINDNEQAENIIGKDILDYFNYTTSAENESISLRLAKDNIAIFQDKSLSPELRDFKISIINQIKHKWMDVTDLLPTDLLEELTKDNKPYQNEVEITIESTKGFIKDIKFMKPSKSEGFNEFCQDFLIKLPRFKSLPKELKKKPSFKVKTNLRYSKNL